ncbi:response regulator [endosymbiont of Lamellibrachia barhami]|uniref:response regulator n=1 Tax=endosymbiont of Lamellibrachia barhami TaxID=205975 RepID=UPI0015B334B5|nr:response regulator [endosymbiont of Lamellibrachia barhami]
MSESNNIHKQSIGELKQVFLRHLPERMTAIDDVWRSLTSNAWDSDKLFRLFQRIQDLAGASSRFGLVRVSETLYSMEAYLGTLLDTDRKPEIEVISHLNESLMSLHDAVDELGQNKTGAGKGKGCLLHYLRYAQDIVPSLIQTLEAENCQILTFNQADDLLGELEKKLPDGLLIDCQLLAQLKPIFDELERLEQRDIERPKLIFLSRSNDLELRLQAMRIGAVGYFTPPFNIPNLTGKILQLVKPDREKTYRVLIVEDDPSQADFAAVILRKANIETLAVTDPLKVMDILDQFRPDLILMDLYMPGANGIELTSIIREQEEFVSIPIVFLSGEQNADKQLDALSVGGDDFISKPIRPRHLVTAVNNRIQRARHIRSAQSTPNQRDPVTGLHTRRFFFMQLDRQLVPASPPAQILGVFYIELGNLSEIRIGTNETQINRLLGQLGSRIAGLVEPQDVAARNSDDSILLLANRPHKKNLEAQAEAIRKAISDTPFEIDGLKLRLEASIGISFNNGHDHSSSEMVTRSSLASANAQAAGGNRTVVFNEGRHIQKENTQTSDTPLEELVRKGLEENAFQLVILPLASTEQQAYIFHELLPRIRSEQGETIPAEQILQTAKRIDRLSDVERWLCGEAISILDERRHEGRQTSIVIHQSAASIEDMGRLQWIRDQLRRRQLVGTGLHMEFDLADLAFDLKRSKAFIRALREMGINISLARFLGNDAAFKVLNYLGANFIRLSKKLLHSEEAAIVGISSKLHESHIKIILPRVDKSDQIAPAWIKHADIMQPDLQNNSGES